MKLLLDIPKEMNKNLKIYKIKQELNTLQESVLKILYEFFYKEGDEDE